MFRPAKSACDDTLRRPTTRRRRNDHPFLAISQDSARLQRRSTEMGLELPLATRRGAGHDLLQLGLGEEDLPLQLVFDQVGPLE